MILYYKKLKKNGLLYLITLVFILAINYTKAQSNCNVPINYTVNKTNNCGIEKGSINVNATSEITSDYCSFDEVNIFQLNVSPSLNDGMGPITGEYVVLSGPVGLDISCYSFTDGDWVITMPSGSVINSTGLFSIGFDAVYGAGTFDLNLEGCNCYSFRGSVTESELLIFTNTGEFLAVFDNEGEFIDGLIYGLPSSTNSTQNTPIAGREYSIANSSCGYSTIVTPELSEFRVLSTQVDLNNNINSYYVNPFMDVVFVGEETINDCLANTLTVQLSYEWNNGETVNNLTELNSGSYFLTVSNNYGCEVKDTIVILGVNEPIYEMTISPVCFGQGFGNVSLNITDGLSYLIEWSNGTIGTVANQLEVGSYAITITREGCVFESEVVVTSIEEPELSLVVQSACEGQNNGSVTITALDIDEYSIEFMNNNVVGHVVDLLEAGTYAFSMTRSGCVFDSSVVIPSLDVDQIFNSTEICQGAIYLVGTSEYNATGIYYDTL